MFQGGLEVIGETSEGGVEPIDFGFKGLGGASGRLRAEFVVPESFEIEQFCIAEGISRDQLFLGVFQALLYRYCGQNDFGVTICQGEVTGLMHLECRGPESFRNLLGRLRKVRPVLMRDLPQVVYYLGRLGDDRHELELGFIERDGDLVGVLYGAEEVFFQKSLEDMGAHFIRTLGSVLKSPEKHLNDIKFLCDEERHLLYHTYADGEEREYVEDVRDLFHGIVLSQAQEIAIQDEVGSMTYEALDKRSNQVAHALQEKGIGVGDVVGVRSRHDRDLVATVIALIKLGATYLPLDPSYPETRIQRMIAEAQPKLVIAQGELVIETQRVDDVKNSVDPEGTAYIIFTSGSTGRPKGIEIANRSLPHASLERTGFYPKKTRSLLMGSIGFDISPLMIFHTLMTGGTLYIPEEAKHVDGEALLEFIARHELNYMMCVPSYYGMLLEKEITLPSSLEIVSLVGEQIPLSLPKEHARLAPHVKLYNEYGPCEVAIGSNYALIYDPETQEIHPITVGRPLPNTQVYVLSPSLLLTALPQMKGEICIGGIGVAKGYLGNERLTREHFVNISLPEGNVKRVYRTGDFGRYLPDGNLEFLGRMDYQVKLRGHRVELGEIENILRRHEKIDEVAVLLNDKGFLVAYYTTILEEPLSKNVVRGYLQNHLPKFMVPTYYMQLDQFPRTIIQKIDRKALPDVQKDAQEKAVPTNDVEDKLVAIWKEILKNASISTEESFFDLGGNSLLLAKVQTKIKEVFHVQIPMIDFFGASTIKDFAKLVKSYGGDLDAVQKS